LRGGTVIRTPVVVVHGGAGSLNSDLREHGAACRDALKEALESAAAVLEEGHDAVVAVRSAVSVLESFPLFNAGQGSALCADGTVEMSAALMRGSDRAAGAVALVTRTEHPIVAAHALLDAPQVLMIGAPADAYAAARGARQREPGYFVVDRQLERLRERANHVEPGHGTVGAVCLDSNGLLAAATSTGGLMGQPPGRVGDTPLIGAGTWADRHVAVSCTGEGEAFIRAGAARLLAVLVARGAAVDAAAQAALDDVRRCDGGGGLIAVDFRGNVAISFSTEAMPRGIWHLGQEPTLELS
jgi:beta-aspartyl-peptidase (threonine type)